MQFEKKKEIYLLRKAKDKNILKLLWIFFTNSINGQPTIVTKDPAFQYVIGQRRTFSEGDVKMINTMYPCGKCLSCFFQRKIMINH